MMYDFAKAVGLPQPPGEIEIYVDHDPERLARAYISHVGDKENEQEWNLQEATDYWRILYAKAGTGYAIIKSAPPDTQLDDGYLRDSILVGGHEMFHIAYQYGLSGLTTNRSWFAEREPDRVPSWLEEGMAEWARHASLAHAGERDYRLSRHEVIEEIRSMKTALPATEWIDDHGQNAEGRRCVFVCGEAAVELLASQVGIRGLTDFYTQLAPGVPWQSTFEEAYGISVDDFYEMFEEHQAADYPELTIPVEVGGDVFFSPEISELPQLDRPTLVAFYNATGGENWTNNSFWLSDEHIGDWHGVTVNSFGRVVELRLTYNGLRGQLPSEMGTLTELRKLGLWANALNGPIPPDMASLSKLEELGLGGNQLSGEIPAWLGSFSSLRELQLVSNQFTGPIPTWAGDLPLRALLLGHNRLSGEIPAELGKLSRLRALYLDGNNLTGCIPSELRDVPDNDFDTASLPFCGQ